MGVDDLFSKPSGGSLVDLEQAASERLKDCEALFEAGRFASAIAFGLYSLEIELKIAICKRLGVGHLPKVFQIHNLQALLLHSGLSQRIRRVKRPRMLPKNWDELENLSDTVEQFRYRVDATWDEKTARRVLHLLRDEPNGVLPWLKKQVSSKVR